MKKTRRSISFVLCLLMVFSLFAGMPIIPSMDLSTKAEAVSSNTNPGGENDWVCAWHTSMMWLNADSSSKISTAVGVLSTLRERTFRTRIQTTMGGGNIRLTYSNEYGTAPLEIGEITIAQGNSTDVDKIDTGKMVAAKDCWSQAIAKGDVVKTKSYYGDTVYAIKAGHTATTDLINISKVGAKAMDYITVSTWITNMNKHKDGITGGLIGGLTHYLGLSVNGSGNYNHTERADLGNIGIVKPIELANSDDTGDYNIIPFLKEIDVQRSTIQGTDETADAYATVVFGDSTLANDIPLILENRLKANKIDGVSFVWSAVKGNEFLLNGQSSVSDNDKNGPAMAESGLNRAYKDAINLPGVKKIIVKLGINDILHPNCNNMQGDFNHTTTANEIIAAYKEFIDLAHAKGIEVYFWELTPWNGYTRNGYISYNSSIDAVRKEVNAWLAKYGTAYDPIKKDSQTDDYTGSVTLGDNYGSKSFTQNCDQKYKNSATNTYTGKAYSHDQEFDSFGYISLDDMSSDDVSLSRALTTDGIHFTRVGQSKVAALTPLSIFWKTDEQKDKLGEEVTIDGLYFATNDIANNQSYYISNSNGASVKNAINQSENAYVAGNPGKETTSKGCNMSDLTAGSVGWRGWAHEDGGQKSDLRNEDVTIQRGTQGPPYIVAAGAPADAKWSLTTTSANENMFIWTNDKGYSGSEKTFFLSWYYPGVKTSDTWYSIGVREGNPRTDSSLISHSNGWYTFNTIDSASDFQSRVRYSGSALGKDKDFIYKPTTTNSDDLKNRNYRDADIENRFTAIMEVGGTIVGKWNRNLTLYRSDENHLKATLDIIQQDNGPLDLTTDKTTVYNKGTGDSIQLYYQLNSRVTDNVGQVVKIKNSSGTLVNGTFTDDGKSNNNTAAGPFSFYTFGDNQRIYWGSTNPDVADVTPSDVTKDGGKITFTGNPGSTNIVLNYFWTDFDGVEYEFDEKYYTEAEMNAAIADGSKVPSETETGYHWVEIKEDCWVWTNFHWLTTSTYITNITDVDCDIVIDSQRVDEYTKTDVINGTSSSLQALEIINPDNADYPEGHWVWTSSNKDVADIDEADGEFANLKYTGKTGSTTVTATYVDSNGNTVTFNDKSLTTSVVVNAVEKPISIDVKINGEINDYYINSSASEGDTINLEAFVEAPYADHSSGTYSWAVYDLEGNESSNVITLSSTTGKNVSASIVGEGMAIAVASYAYTDSTGTAQTATSAVYINIDFGIHSNSVVYDFGLPVKVDLVKGSYIGADLSASGISATAPEGVELVSGKTSDDKLNAAKSAALTYGDASLGDNVITYTPDKIASGIDTVYYSTEVTDGFKYAKLDMIPATSVYYEDSFVDFGEIDYTNDELGVFTKNTYSWVKDGTTAEGKVQSADKEVYGTDPTYGEFTTFSMGSAMKTTVSPSVGANVGGNNKYPAAQFTFKGTGFEIFSFNTNTAGAINVYVDKIENGNVADSVFFTVNNYSQGDYYQIPVISWLGNAYGEYKVTVEVSYDKYFDKTGANEYSFWLDAIRVYDPVNGDATAEGAYIADGEGFPEYTSIRKLMLGTSAFNAIGEGESVQGTVLVDAIVKYTDALDENNNPIYILDKDGKPTDKVLQTPVVDEDGNLVLADNAEAATVADYKNNGPKNEVYLKPGQGVAFKVEKGDNVADIQVGAKLVNGTSAKLYLNGNELTELKGATEMYYSMLDKIGDDGYVVLTNNSGAIISLTNLKVTYSADPAVSQTSARMMASAPAAKFAVRTMNMMFAPAPDVDTTDDPQVTDDPQPTDNPDDGNDKGDQSNGIVKIIQTVVTAVKSFFGKLFRR